MYRFKQQCICCIIAGWFNNNVKEQRKKSSFTHKPNNNSNWEFGKMEKATNMNEEIKKSNKKDFTYI